MSEKKSIIQTVAAVALCATIGILSQNTTGLQKAAFGRVIVGGPMLALLVSMIACNILPSLSKGFKEGTSLCAKKFLNWGIVATGGTLSFAAIMGTGVKAPPPCRRFSHPAPASASSPSTALPGGYILSRRP